MPFRPLRGLDTPLVGQMGMEKIWSGAHKYKERVTSVDGLYRSKFHFSEVGAVLFQLCYSL